jgi:hypothetical protein
MGGVGALVERGGRVRSHHVLKVTSWPRSVEAQLRGATAVYTDYTSKNPGRTYEKHAGVNHSIREYVRGDAHTNTSEGFFSIMKRGIDGIYHHLSQQHLKRYLAESL